MQQYRDILGVQGAGNLNNRRSAADNDWVIESALRKANQQTLLKVEEVARDDNRPAWRPTTATVSRRQQEGEALTVKEMRIAEDLHNNKVTNR